MRADGRMIRPAPPVIIDMNAVMYGALNGIEFWEKYGERNKCCGKLIWDCRCEIQ